MVKLGIIIPAHNEERRIGNTLNSYLEYYKKKDKLEFDIIVVLNACTDNTREIMRRYKTKELVVLDFKRGGKGFAVIEGFKEALKRNCDIIGFVDADMATKPEHFDKLVDKIPLFDGAIASRYVRGAIVKPKNTLPRILASRLLNSVIRAVLLIPYRDTQCGAKVFSRRAIRAVISNVGMTQWAFDIELIYRIRNEGFEVLEVPTVWASQEYSKINFWKTGPWMTLAVFRLRLLNSPARFIIGIYDRVLGRLHRTLMRRRIVK